MTRPKITKIYTAYAILLLAGISCAYLQVSA